MLLALGDEAGHNLAGGVFEVEVEGRVFEALDMDFGFVQVLR